MQDVTNKSSNSLPTSTLSSATTSGQFSPQPVPPHLHSGSPNVPPENLLGDTFRQKVSRIALPLTLRRSICRAACLS